MRFNNSELLINQYADESSLSLDDSEESLKHTLCLLDKFSECAGLRANWKKYGLAQDVRVDK